MPKTIKISAMPPQQKLYRIFTVISFVVTCGFMGVCAYCFKALSNEELSGNVLLLVFSALFALSLLLVLLSAVFSFVCFKKNNDDLAAVNSFLLCVIFLCYAINSKFIAVIFSYGAGRTDWADRIAGETDAAVNSFLSTQYGCWAAFTIAAFVLLILAVISILKLAKR